MAYGEGDERGGQVGGVRRGDVRGVARIPFRTGRVAVQPGEQGAQPVQGGTIRVLAQRCGGQDGVRAFQTLRVGARPTVGDGGLQAYGALPLVGGLRQPVDARRLGQGAENQHVQPLPGRPVADGLRGQLVHPVGARVELGQPFARQLA